MANAPKKKVAKTEKTKKTDAKAKSKVGPKAKTVASQAAKKRAVPSKASASKSVVSKKKASGAAVAKSAKSASKVKKAAPKAAPKRAAPKAAPKKAAAKAKPSSKKPTKKIETPSKDPKSAKSKKSRKAATGKSLPKVAAKTKAHTKTNAKAQATPKPIAPKTAKVKATEKGQSEGQRPVDKKASSKRAKEDSANKLLKSAGEPAPKKTKKQAIQESKERGESASTVEVEVAEIEMLADEEEIVLTDADGNRLCKVTDCDQVATVDGFCRYHYLLFWKRIQNRKKILADGKLQKYIEELTARYPDKFVELLSRDLRSEKDFLAALTDLEIDDSGDDNQFEDDSEQLIDEMRGVSSDTGSLDADDDY